MSFPLFYNGEYRIPEGVLLPENTSRTEAVKMSALLTVIRSLMHYNFHYRYKNKDYDGFVDISAKWYEKIFGMDFCRILHKLVEYDFLVKKKCSIIGVRTNRYAIHPRLTTINWIGASFEEVCKIFCSKICGNKNKINYLQKIIDKVQEDAKSLSEVKSSSIKKVKEHERSVLFTQNIKEGVIYDLIVEKGTINFYKNEEKRRKQLKKNIPYISLEESIKGVSYCAEMIEKQTWFVKMDKLTGRIYYPVANLYKKLRPFLTFNGKPLCEIDVKTCQPCLLSLFYEDTPEDQEEKLNFINFVTNKDIDFYTELGNVAGISDRSEAKRKSFIILFGEKRHQNSKIGIGFSKLFPILSSRLDKVREKNYKKIAQRMQTSEAHIMIDGVLNEFGDLYPGRCSLPIHDSFLVLEEDVELIKPIIKKHFLKEIGFEPILNVKKFQKQNDSAIQ